MTEAANSITDARYFLTWWHSRRNDAVNIKAAVKAGLVICGADMLVLTGAGKALRQTTTIRRKRRTKRAKATGGAP